MGFGGLNNKISEDQDETRQSKPIMIAPCTTKTINPTPSLYLFIYLFFVA